MINIFRCTLSEKNITNITAIEFYSILFCENGIVKKINLNEISIEKFVNLLENLDETENGENLFLETLYISNRLKLPLNGILLVGY